MKKSNEISEYPEELVLADVFSDIIAAGSNKNIICLIEAIQGTGKSWSILDVCTWCAVGLAEKLGGNPWDYFTLDNVAIIMPDETMRVVKRMKKFDIVLFDDVSVGYSCRKWQSKSNEAINNLLQTMRTDNNIIFLTVPDSESIDKTGRNSLHFKMYMDRPLHNLGLTLGRLSTVKKLYNSANRKTIYPYLKLPKKVYNNVRFDAPPKIITDEYEKRRAYQLNRLKEMSMEALETEFCEVEDEDKSDEKNDKWTRKDIAIIETKEEHPDWSVRRIGDTVGVGKSKVAKVLKKHNLDKLSSSASAILT